MIVGGGGDEEILFYLPALALQWVTVSAHARRLPNATPVALCSSLRSGLAFGIYVCSDQD